ncbi:DUF2502 domain-containing protein [Mixta intestinalis]|uniref:DUF2502 domain-containing protein n=1 Tax=Mixta intestinalis TaxID=1615494 RepID=A0A6P1PYC8_9GAMM|nr:DUF2502 domain-containing protein [Mixta intestinalis]QHM70869.1 hypothetical protein C7M51_01149 [Mixta intestinalis]
MKIKTAVSAIALSLLLGVPAVSNAAVSFDIAPAGITIHIGDRDRHGNYWDGYDWRAPEWWRVHHGRNLGERGPHGYWNGNGWQPHPPQHHAEPHRRPAEHNRPVAHHDMHDGDRLTAEHDGHGAPDRRAGFHPHS